MVVFAISSLASIFAIMNPIANVPIFMALTADKSQTEQRILARRSALKPKRMFDHFWVPFWYPLA